MRRLALTLILVALAGPAARAQQASKSEVVREKAVQAFKAFIDGDYDRFVAMTYPKVVEGVGGKKKMIEVLRDGASQMKSAGVSFRSATPEAPTQFARAGSQEVAIVPYKLVMKVPEGTLTTPSFVLGVSGDGGKSWTFIDGQALTADAVRRILPDFPRDLKLPERAEPEFKRD